MTTAYPESNNATVCLQSHQVQNYSYATIQGMSDPCWEMGVPKLKWMIQVLPLQDRRLVLVSFSCLEIVDSFVYFLYSRRGVVVGMTMIRVIGMMMTGVTERFGRWSWIRSTEYSENEI